MEDLETNWSKEVESWFWMVDLVDLRGDARSEVRFCKEGKGRVFLTTNIQNYEEEITVSHQRSKGCSSLKRLDVRSMEMCEKEV